MKPSTLVLAAALGLAVAMPWPSSAQQAHGEGHGESMQGSGHETGMSMQDESGAVAATGVVNTVDADTRSVNLSHEPIPAIGWPAMTMDMNVADHVDLESVDEGQPVDFTIQRGADGIYQITDLKPAD